MKKYTEHNDILKKKLEYIDKQLLLGQIKNETLHQIAQNFHQPTFNLKIIITFMKCVNYLLYMIGIKRKFNMSLSRIWYFFNNIDKIEEIDEKIKRRKLNHTNQQYMDTQHLKEGINQNNHYDHDKKKSSSSYIFFDVFFNFDLFF